MNKGRTKQPDIPAWEWGVAAVGLFVFLGAIGFFTICALSDQHPPAFRLQVDSVRAAAVHFTVRNEGDVTAADVIIGAADGPAGPTVQFDFVPAHSQRSGVLFRTSAQPGEVRLQVHSYVVP